MRASERACVRACVPACLRVSLRVCTGIGRPRRERKNALAKMKSNSTVDDMDLSLDRDEMRSRMDGGKGTELFFVKLGHFEGEFKVGLARVEAIPDNGVVTVSW